MLKNSPNNFRILIGCEESQTVCKAFRRLGFEAFSCDLLPCSGGHPEWHFQMDVFECVKELNPTLAIFHPECTRLTVAANKYYKPEYSERFPNIQKERYEAIGFFMDITSLDIKYMAIENPIGIMSRIYKKSNNTAIPVWR